MREKQSIFLWTTRNTFVKAWIKNQRNGIRRVEIDYESHPYLKENPSLKITPDILGAYDYNRRKNYPFPSNRIPVQN